MKLLLAVTLIFSTIAFTCSGEKQTGNNDKKTEQEEKVINRENIFIGKTDEVGILVEDNKTIQKDKDFNFKSDNGYTNYITYVREFVKKYKDPNAIEVTFDEYMPEFDRITSLKPHDKFYIATKENVLEGEVGRYFVNIDDEIGSGNMFYAILDLPNALLIPAGEPVIASREKLTSPIKAGTVTDASVISSAKKILEPLVKNLKMYDETGNQEGDKPVTIEDDDLTIIDMSNSEYAVSFNKRIQFDSFTGMMFTMNKNGDLLSTLSPFTPGDFGYSKLVGIIDVNGDGKFEYLVESGYYEGMGYLLYEFRNGKLNEIVNGFFFGV